MDPGIAKLIERTRARRGELKELSTESSPLPSERDRSPLKQRNRQEDSPVKASNSPVKNKKVSFPDSPSDTVKRLLSRESLETNVADLMSRESPGKTLVTRTVSTKVSPSKTTITKTVITEKEEKYEKKEIISYSGNKEFLDTLGDKFDKLEQLQPNKENVVDSTTYSKTTQSQSSKPSEQSSDLQSGRKARLANLASKFKNLDDEEPTPRHIQLPKSVTKPAPRALSPSKHAPVKTDHIRSASPVKSSPHINPQQFISPQVNQSPTKPSDNYRSQSPVKSFRSVSPTKAAPTYRSVSPTKAPAPPPPALPTAGSPAAKTIFSSRSVSPSKAPDASFVTSLKAQGFQESESKTRLVYDFEKEKESTRPQREQSLSPSRSPVKCNMFIQQDMENIDNDRNVSPVRANPFLLKDKQTRTSPTRTEERGRSAVKKPTQIRASSPEKPHPLQFVTPQQEQPPPKPSRTYETKPVPQPEQSAPTRKSWKPSLMKPTINIGQDDTNDRMDSPAMKSVSQKRDMFEQGQVTPEAEQPDPALMSMSQRKALFEKNKSVPTPIARFGESVTPAMLLKAKPQETASMTPAEAWKRKRAVSPGKHQPHSSVKPEPVKSSQVCTPRVPQPSSMTPAPLRPAPPPAVSGTPSTPQIGKKTGEMHKKLFANNDADWRENEIARKANEEKQSEMNLLMNRYNHLRKSGDPNSPAQQPAHVEPNTNTPPPPPPPPQEDVYYPGVNSMKRVKVSPPKPGNLYPQVDFDSDTLSSQNSRPESVMSTDTMNSSFESCVTTTASEAPSLGMEIVAAARSGGLAHDQELSTIAEDNNDSMETDDGDVMTDSVLGAEIDDILDEAMDNDDDAPTPPKIFKSSTSSSGSDQIERSESTTSWEFHTPQPTRKHHKDKESKFQTPLISTSSPSTPQQRVEIEGEDGPLMHTVSFYRKQKPATATPVQRIVLNPRLESQPEVLESPRATITQKIHQLQEDAGSQMPVIQQASSALTLCRATKEFFGSSEQVEGERLLLVATHKRAAALNEIQRLKTEGGIGADPRQDHSVRGTVSLCGVTLGLKREFVEQLRSGESGDFVHFFLCLVKCAGQVIPTQMVSTAEGLDGTQLHFPNLINFRDLNKDFTIQLEVYGLQTRRESLPHDAKYHIKKGKSTFNLTPKLKISKTESKLSRPNVSSPGGPHTVRTSSFAMVGNALITISSLARKDWRLESVPKISPLDGSVSFKLNCHSESQVTNRGFLTMFDDVSGFGAWHRRWFVLEGNSLSFWKYPENEKVQEPIGRLDLGQSVTRSVSLCPREVCSRMHTFMLETSRPATREDRESLVVVRQGSTTILRHLLSADSRNERVAWCDILNQALDNLRAWDTVRHRSGSVSSSDSAEATSSVSTEIW